MNTPPLPQADGATGAGMALCIIGDCSIRLFGRTLPERIAGQFAQAGLARRVTAEEAPRHDGDLIIVRADAMIDEPLIPRLLQRQNFILVTNKGKVPVAAHVKAAQFATVLAALQNNSLPSIPGHTARAPQDLDLSFWKDLRKRETPYSLVVTPDTERETAWRVFLGTCAGTTDLVSKQVWPHLAFQFTKLLAGLRVPPNMVTAVSAAAAIAVCFLFLHGLLGWGLLAAWLVSFLDMVDGKLARSTLASSSGGRRFDHGLDLVFPPLWYVAWALGLAAEGRPLSHPLVWWVVAMAAGGHAVLWLLQAASVRWLGVDIHIWRRFDTFFRQISAGRNLSLLLLSFAWLVFRPDFGLIAVAVWTAISIAVLAVQLVQGGIAKKTAGGALSSWMAR